MILHTIGEAEPIELRAIPTAGPFEIAEQSLTGEQLAADAAALFDFLCKWAPAGTVDHLAQLILQFDATREESAELQAAADFYDGKILRDALTS